MCTWIFRLCDRLSASCVHVSAVLHCLVALRGHKFMTPATESTSELSGDDDQPLPITSFACQWKQPKKRKETNLKISDADFSKHQFGDRKRTYESMNEYDPRPVSFRYTAAHALPRLLESVRDNEPKLGVSVLLDGTLAKQCESTDSDVQKQCQVIISTLTLSEDDIRKVEQETRKQQESEKWHELRRKRLTASNFGRVRTLSRSTRPDALLKQILYPKSLDNLPAIKWGQENEAGAVAAYIEFQQQNKENIVVTKSGFCISSANPFLGASPDGCVYDPYVPECPFGFLEVKCPYKYRDVHPIDACTHSDFCGSLHGGKFELKRSHHYYAQVQGQMAIGNRNWCDFVVWTTKGVLVEQ